MKAWPIILVLVGAAASASAQGSAGSAADAGAATHAAPDAGAGSATGLGSTGRAAAIVDAGAATASEVTADAGADARATSAAGAGSGSATGSGSASPGPSTEGAGSGARPGSSTRPGSAPRPGAGDGSGSASRSGSDAGSGSAVGSASTVEVEPPPAPAAPTVTPPVQPKLAPPAAAPPAQEVVAPTDATENSLFAIKVIGGLVALLVLAYLGGHRQVVRFQERLGIGGVITAGFPFVALGAIATPPLGRHAHRATCSTQLRPVLHFGLGWLGFIIGAQLDIRVLDRVPKGTAYLILVEALGPFGDHRRRLRRRDDRVRPGCRSTSPALWRDLILLGTAAAMTAPRKFRGFANRTWHEGRGVDVLLAQLDEIVGVIGLLFITAYFRDDTGGTWQLPDTAWIFVSLGLGVAIGVLIFAMVRVPVSNAEFLAVVLGGIAFASGLAGYLQLSPIAICFIAGVLVTNFPNEQRESIFRILNHLERPVHLLFLIIAGAVWDVGDWRGWVLVPLFVAGPRRSASGPA